MLPFPIPSGGPGQPGAASRPTMRRPVCGAVDRDGDGGGGGRSAWWMASSGRKSLLHRGHAAAALIGAERIESFLPDRARRQPFRSESRTRDGISCPGPRQQVHRCVRCRGHRRLITHYADTDPGNEAAWRGTRDRSPGLQVPQPHTTRPGSGHPQAAPWSKANSTSASPGPGDYPAYVSARRLSHCRR
jgi:hypothetical protein